MDDEVEQAADLGAKIPGFLNRIIRFAHLWLPCPSALN